jgi:hypothetical protein
MQERKRANDRMGMWDDGKYKKCMQHFMGNFGKMHFKDHSDDRIK